MSVAGGIPHADEIHIPCHFKARCSEVYVLHWCSSFLTYRLYFLLIYVLSASLLLKMADPWEYTYPSPLEGYEGLEPLPKYVRN